MAEPARADIRYTAFLSYSHKDAAAAARLHRRLESYRVPKRLVGSESPRGPVPRRLWPIFRDREELPAATDLSETVRTALAQSGALIILCSPNAAGSLWVAEEIETFRRLHPDRPILAAILDGDPPDCFPQALRALGQDGTWHEPLATDLRPKADGRHLGLLKLVAGITGLGLDDLVQRDAARRIRRVMAVTAAALIMMLGMAALALVALQARGEADRQRVDAQRQRAEAEGLIEFMLTDLRTRLEGVGRLDIMTAVNRRALAHYGGQEELGGLSPDSLERRARILHLMGNDDLRRDNFPMALVAFREAHRTTEEQLARAPNDPARIFAHSQSEFWLGRVPYQRHDYAAAREAWQRYKMLADRLSAMDPRNADWLKEAAYAEGNLCTVMLRIPADARYALPRCERALELMERAARSAGNSADYDADLANRHSYVADALMGVGRHRDALNHRQMELDLVRRALAREPANVELQGKVLWALRGIAHHQFDLGQRALAQEGMRNVRLGVERLTRLDPTRREWRDELERIHEEEVRIRQGRRPRNG